MRHYFKKLRMNAILVACTLFMLQGNYAPCHASGHNPIPNVPSSVGADTLKQNVYVYAHSDDGFVNVRKQPSTRSAKVGELRNGGAGALFLGHDGEWLKVRYNGEQAYVYSRYARIGKAPEATSERSYYYIVIASFEDLKQAKETAEDLPNSMRRPVYRFTSDGKAKYRICESCFDTRDKALTHKKELDLRYGESDIWILENRGLADCIYCPGVTRGANNRIRPLSPQ